VGLSSILVTKLTPPFLGAKPKLLDLLTTALKKNAQILSTASLAQAGYEGKSFIVEIKQKGETNYARIDYIVTATHLYQVTLSTKRRDTLDSPEYQNFFASFRVR
jgi:hypothetical protein